MKTVALLVVYLGYGLVCYGVDHVQANCTPFGCVMLGRFAGTKCASGTVPCKPAGKTVTKAQLNKQGHGHTQTVQTATTGNGQKLSFGIGTAG